ncbi:hypothetical protein [Nocardia suismassiliense]|uniref:hypothetical protein n=1 Tax=Nocardia suismassiliense TaxID=2077092 RepID=UPI000D1D6CA9|nr:hypothetical protein [Nocardia suismassiliense]
MRIPGKIIAVAATTTLLGSLSVGWAQAQPAADYPAAEYRLEIYYVQIRDISHRVDPEEYCAEIYGIVDVQDYVSAAGYTFFRAERDEAVEVCEPNRPEREGTQSGLLRAWAYGTTEITKKFTGDKAKDTPFTFEIDLWDRDPVGGDDHLMQKTVSVWPPKPGVKPPSISDDPTDPTVYVEYAIINKTKKDEEERARQQFEKSRQRGEAYGNCRRAGGTDEECQKAAASG